ncbi:MAG TPA: TIGR01777 family oxidoreductase [Chitinophagaceae bacterium]
MATVLITGGTGMIGTALTKLLCEKGYDVIILTRNPKPRTRNQKPETRNISYAKWDIKSQTIDIDAIKKADHIINLAGANVGEKRWTKKRKREIVESRTLTGSLIVKALKENSNNVRSVISPSGIGWYGEDTIASLKHGGFAESEPAYDDFLGQTCVQWEQSIEPVKALGKRLVILRCGVVLSNEGGVIREFKKPLYAGVASILGNGKQIMSWIHIDDICRLYLFALENEEMNGIYNAVAHQPVSNKSFVLEFAKQMRGKYYLPVHVPAFVLKLVVGEMSIEVLKSATVSNEKVRHAGFKFLYPTIQAAFNQLTKSE